MKYVPNIVHTTEFAGDQVTATLEPLGRGDVMKAYGVLKGFSGVSDAESLKSRAMDMYGTAVDILQAALIKIEGVRDANGNAVPKEVILDKVIFMPLVNELFGVLVARARLGEAKSVVSEPK